MSRRFALGFTVAALVVGAFSPVTNGRAHATDGLRIVAVTPTTRDASLSTTSINVVKQRRDLRFKVAIRNSGARARQVRVTLVVTPPHPSLISARLSTVSAGETKTVTLQGMGQIFYAQKLVLTVTVRAGKTSVVRRSYPVIFIKK